MSTGSWGVLGNPNQESTAKSSRRSQYKPENGCGTAVNFIISASKNQFKNGCASMGSIERIIPSCPPAPGVSWATVTKRPQQNPAGDPNIHQKTDVAPRLLSFSQPPKINSKMVMVQWPEARGTFHLVHLLLAWCVAAPKRGGDFSVRR